MRKVSIVDVPDNYGRDRGKTFKLKEWPAMRAEKWAWRMGICLKGTSAAIPDDVTKLGIIGVTTRIVNGVLAADIDETKFLPLLDEMMECVQIVRVRSTPDPLEPKYPLGEPPILDDDIEEPHTVAWLRSEVLKLHTGFDIAEGISSLLSAAKSSAEASPTT